jgi:hypothetical protein
MSAAGVLPSPSDDEKDVFIIEHEIIVISDDDDVSQPNKRARVADLGATLRKRYASSHRSKEPKYADPAEDNWSQNGNCSGDENCPREEDRPQEEDCSDDEDEEDCPDEDEEDCPDDEEFRMKLEPSKEILQKLRRKLSFKNYAASFTLARSLKRKVTFFAGPPNSGKSFAAFDHLAAAPSGAYLAPLRLLAQEGCESLRARGILCSLRTGEEKNFEYGAMHVSSTIETVNIFDCIACAVIDEGQLIYDESRGWAWTRAILACPAEELIIVCSTSALQHLQRLVGLCGETWIVREFSRMQGIELIPTVVPEDTLQAGDAVIAFSRASVIGSF